MVAAIVPWNYPQALAAFKLAPALAAGCRKSCSKRHPKPRWTLWFSRRHSADIPPGC